MATASSTIGRGVVVSPLPLSPATAAEPADIIETFDGEDQAKAKQEMFLAGAINGGVAGLSTVIPTESLPSQFNASKYPDSWVITELSSSLEVKKWWLYNEWSPHCKFSGGIQKAFPNQETLHPETGDANKELIESTFEKVRGQFLLWQSPKESAKWIKAVVKKLKLSWVEQHVTVLYPSKEKFKVSELNGLVSWKKPDAKKYELIEGNHRVSAWKLSGKPKFLPCLLFIGAPQEGYET